MTDTTHDSTYLSTTLTSRARGPVRTPDADGGALVRGGFQLLDPHRPAAVVEAADGEDVRLAVDVARERGMRITVEATGHGRGAGARGGVLIDTHRLCGVRVDPRARTAWVEAGATWQHVIEAATPHGLAPLSGSFPGVGAVSYTLGGGIGLLARRYGFAADHVHRIDVVTADGRARRVTADDDPDLFWALRGGGGNFGVVTGMEIALVPLTHLYGGGLFFDTERVPDVLNRWREWTATVPEEMTSAVSMLPFPDVAAVPEPLRGRHVAQLQISYAGPVEQGERLVEPLRALGPLLRDTLCELSYAESGTVFDEPAQPHGYRSTNLLFDDLDPQALATLTRRAGPSAPAMCVVGIRHLGGALTRAPRNPGAVGHRAAGYCLGILSPAEPGEETGVLAHHRDLLAPLREAALGPCLNFTFGSLGRDELRAAFEPADRRRLSRLKARYDPRELLHANHPIPAEAD